MQFIKTQSSASLQATAQEALLSIAQVMPDNSSGPCILPCWVISQGFLFLFYWSKQMPKIKTNRGAAKRFRRTGNGGFKCGQSHRRHILTKKSTKRKRQLRSPATIHPSDVRMAARMMPYS
jgi:large subunit ribosomal protein L35